MTWDEFRTKAANRMQNSNLRKKTCFSLNSELETYPPKFLNLIDCDETYIRSSLRHVSYPNPLNYIVVLCFGNILQGI